MSDDRWHFVAELHMLTTKEGGRATAFVAGKSIYRPQFSMSSFPSTTSCFIDKIEGKEQLEPGETGVIWATLLRPEFFAQELKSGARFELHEGSRCVGLGTIKDVSPQLITCKFMGHDT